MASLANRYRPQSFDDVVGQTTVVNIVKAMCESETLSNRNFLFTGPAGTGKAQPLYSKILTPTGFITMGEVQVGTEVITHTGAIGNIIGIFPQGVRPIYELVLADGGKIRVADNHLNLVCVDGTSNVITTDCLLNCISAGHTVTIPSAKLSRWNIDVPEYTEYREVIDIQYIGKQFCQCIYVDHPDHTYISDDFIPTHNTTLGRIIAKSLNGSTDNIIEVDAASHSGVDDIRELIQEASQYPVGTKYKIIVLDEVHSLSNQAFQALLKCLEEQVGNTVWILCTTNPEKIPATIISRVQTFKLSKLSTKTIQDRLKYILDTEVAEGRNIIYEDAALSYLARLAQGGMRDAITSLDKCLAFDTQITVDVVIKALDLPSYDDYFNLLNALVRKDNADITAIVDKVYNSGTNFVKWFEGFHSFLCNIVKFIFLKDISRTMIPSNYLDKLEKYGSQHAFVCLKLANVVMTMNKELKLTQYQMETAMTYLCTPVAPKKGGEQ